MTRHTFTPDLRDLATFAPTATVADLVEEGPGCYAASPAFVRAHCGPIANRILDAVPDAYFEACNALGMLPNIDVRVHRLNPGEFPAVPGWHCDGALRETYFAQPQLDRIAVRDTVVATVSSHPNGVSNTQFLAEPVTVDLEGDPNVQPALWARVHEQVARVPRRVTHGLDGHLYGISVNTLHRAMPAHNRGVRLFFRMSMWHNAYLGDGGKLAHQQQVYILQEGKGW